MFTTKKHSPYRLRYNSTPQDLENLLDQTIALYNQALFVVGRIQQRWEHYGYSETEEATEARPWFEKITLKLSKSVLDVDQSVLEFNKYANLMQVTYFNL